MQLNDTITYQYLQVRLNHEQQYSAQQMTQFNCLYKDSLPLTNPFPNRANG